MSHGGRSCVGLEPCPPTPSPLSRSPNVCKMRSCSSAVMHLTPELKAPGSKLGSSKPWLSDGDLASLTPPRRTEAGGRRSSVHPHLCHPPPPRICANGGEQDFQYGTRHRHSLGVRRSEQLGSGATRVPIQFRAFLDTHEWEDGGGGRATRCPVAGDKTSEGVPATGPPAIPRGHARRGPSDLDPSAHAAVQGRDNPGNNQHNPQYANYWAPLTRKRHIPPHSAQPRHTNDWAPRTRKRHQQEHRPQLPTERSDPTQHAKGRTGDRPGPRKETTTRRNVTQGGGGIISCRDYSAGGNLPPSFIVERTKFDFSRPRKVEPP